MCVCVCAVLAVTTAHAFHAIASKLAVTTAPYHSNTLLLYMCAHCRLASAVAHSELVSFVGGGIDRAMSRLVPGWVQHGRDAGILEPRDFDEDLHMHGILYT